jgi:protein-S-isoprenylcysteine O-methyltransferase Ste14
MRSFFDVFQLAALAAFLVLFLGRAVHMRLTSGVGAFHLSAGKALPQALLEGLFLIGLPLWLFEVLAHSWPLAWHPLPQVLHASILDSPLVRVTGAGLVTFGLLLFAAALLDFGDSWRVGIDRDTPGQLVTRGIFAWSRNPIFVFLDCYALGVFLITGELLFGLIALIVVGGLHYQIREEERFLAELHGEAYRAYCARTPRYIGWRHG